jgi:hypothetical protein
VWFGIYVYIWSSIKTVQILKAKKSTSFASYLATTFFFITQLLGIALLAILVVFTWILPGQLIRGLGGIDPLAVILILGLLMIPAQAISVALTSKLGKPESKREFSN